MDISSSDSSTNSVNSVSFGTVTMREYERQIDNLADVDLGLTLGWNFQEHSPKTVDEFSSSSDNHHQQRRYMEPTSEGERADILLENGYSKRQLRSAIQRRHRRMDSDEIVSMPKSVKSTPTRVLRKVYKGVKWFCA